MRFCCEGLEDALKSGFCRFTVAKSVIRKDEIDSVVGISIGCTRIDYCPFCGQKVSVTLQSGEQE